MSANLNTNVVLKYYSTKSNAARAARSVGIANYDLYTFGDQWGIRPLQADAHVATYINKLARQVTTLTHKQFSRYERSAITQVVAYVHNFLNTNPGITRKDALYALALAGVNQSTARTQYQVWRVAQRG